MVVSDVKEIDFDVAAAEEVPLNAEIATENDFFGALKAAKVHELWVPELGKKVLIRIISGREADAYRSSIVTGKGTNISLNQKGMRAKLAVLSVANKDGSRMFTDSDVHRVMEWPGIVLERIFDRSRKINGLTDDDTDGAKDEEKGNS